MKFSHTKGQISIGNIGTYALLFGIAVIITVVLSGILTSVKDTALSDATSTFSVSNETVTGNGTLANAGALGRNTNIILTTVSVEDGAVAFAISSANWTMTDQGVLTRNFTTGNDNIVNVTYDYYGVASTAAINVSTKGSTGLINLAGQYGNTGTVVGAALIIGIIITIFAIRSKGDGVSFA